MMSFVALPWQLFQLTKSSFAVGLLGAAEFVAIFRWRLSVERWPTISIAGAWCD
jgi:hypothetical protein